MHRQRHLRLLGVLVVAALLLAMTGGGQALAQGTSPAPVLPQSFWGSVKDASGNPVTSGTVEAWMNGVKQDSIAVINGQYGGPGGFDERLIVRGTSDDEGKTIEFFVNGVKANETAKYAPGEKTNLNLTVNLSPQPPQDRTPPEVQSCDPQDGAINVPVNKIVTVTFTEDAQEGSQYAGISLVDRQNNPVTLQKSISGKVLALKPAADLAYYKTYTVTIPAGAVKDGAGNELAQACVFSFTTAAQTGSKVEVTVPPSGVLDSFVIPPGASAVVLNQGSAQVEIPQDAFSGAARITFKNVDKTNFPGAGVIGQVFEIKIENVNLLQPVTLSLPVPAGERPRVYKLVGSMWKNLGGTARGGFVEVQLSAFSTFTSANAPAAPTANPAPGSYTGSVQVTLSADPGAAIYYSTDGSYPSTLYASPITMNQSATIKAMALKEGLESDVVTFSYTVSASSGSGGSGGGGGGGGSAVVRPSVSSADPASDATGVAADKVVTIIFSEDVQQGDDFGKIALRDGAGNQVDCSVSLSGNKLMVAPKERLAYGTTYTLLIPAGAVKDSDGYAMSQDYTLTFTTTQAPPKPPAASFKDMAGHWAEATVVKLAGMGVISGYEDGTFRPDNTITRAEAASILVRALKLPEASENELAFADKDAIPAWAKKSVAQAAKAGLLKGYPADGGFVFRAQNALTRAELAAIMSRAAAQKGLPQTQPAPAFKDQLPDWAKEAVALAARTGLVGGYPDGTFRPDKPVTRAEAASMVLRLLEKIE